jgi:hypothetical protein
MLEGGELVCHVIPLSTGRCYMHVLVERIETVEVWLEVLLCDKNLLPPCGMQVVVEYRVVVTTNVILHI